MLNSFYPPNKPLNTAKYHLFMVVYLSTFSVYFYSGDIIYAFLTTRKVGTHILDKLNSLVFQGLKTYFNSTWSSLLSLVFSVCVSLTGSIWFSSVFWWPLALGISFYFLRVFPPSRPVISAFQGDECHFQFIWYFKTYGTAGICKKTKGNKPSTLFTITEDFHTAWHMFA